MAHRMPLLQVLFLLPLLVQLHFSLGLAIGNSTTMHHTGLQSLPHQAMVLLEVKQSFSLSSNDPSMILPSWQTDKDCCSHWEGVTCDKAGRVTALSLSNCDLAGNVPIHISELIDLVSLDLSFNDELRLHEPSFQTIVANLSKLTKLHLDRVKISSTAAECFRALVKSIPRLEVLTMPGCNLSSPVDNSLPGLRWLSVIDLSYNFITYPPGFFSRFHSLRVLKLGSSNLQTFPLEILQLRNLKVLNLWSANISGCIPYYIGNLTSLTELDLSNNVFSGGLPSTISNLTSLRIMRCVNCSLSGEIKALANLTQLESVYLSDNNFTGPIYLGDRVKLNNLESLYLSFNSLSGRIPLSLFTHPALSRLDLSRNQFSGALGEFSNPSLTLTEVILSGNHLCGPVPKSFGWLASLESLSLDHNYFTGTLELFSYFRLRNISWLSASNNNLFSVAWHASNAENSSSSNSTSSWLGTYPLKTDQSHLSGLDLSWNQISGEIPSWIWSKVVRILNLSHNKFTAVAQPLANTTVMYIDLSYNMLHGAVPLVAAGLNQDYSHNRFSSIPSSNFTQQFRAANSINLSNNEISGPVPLSECSTSDSLRIIDLSNNNFSGPVPSYLLNCKSLDVLRLRGNHLTGVWPDNVEEGCSLHLIDLSRNQITGHLPRSLSSCQELVFLDVGENFITDSFPYWTGELPNLRILVLRSNQFYGSLPSIEENSTLEYFQDLQIIDIANNRFNGALPTNLFQNSKLMIHPAGSGGGIYATSPESEEWFCPYLLVVDIEMKELYIDVSEIQTDFVLIDLSHNRFHGLIPTTIGKLSALHVLNMSGNSFTGEIPHELGNLVHLESLDLSWNRLSGEIPQELAMSLTSLEWLNLSYNTLSGRIPSGPQISTFPSSSFQGNEGLYGCPLPIQCTLAGSPPKDPKPFTPLASKSKGERFDDIMLHLFIGLGFGGGFSAAVMVRLVYSGRWWHYSSFPTLY
ncbi:hypothetical protein SETIT_6G199300v2 [Setaria italica]|uniref:Uncharacterized protein n=1 Tax=Setaria italica TaxID=4555 RepID=A0A368RNK5_SETIT|nr:hypothetical protein SETIT_6G199300v2 [Setaria italica]